MTSLFERCLLQAVKRRRVDCPTRLKAAILLFHEAYLSQSARSPNANTLIHDPENMISDTSDKQNRDEKREEVEDISEPLMRKGFGVIPKCE